MCSRVRGCVDADAIAPATDPLHRRRRLLQIDAEKLTRVPRSLSAPSKCRVSTRGAMLREVELAEPSGSGRAAGDAEGVDVDDDDARLLPAALEPAGGTGRGTTGWARSWRRLRDAVRAEPLLLQTLAGVAVGVVVGTIARATDPSPRAVELLGFPGELFMRLLRALVLPLVSVSMVCGVLALSEKTSAAGARRAVGRLIGSYVLTTLVACFIGLVIVHVVRPGVGVALDASKCVDSNAASGGAEADADGEMTKNDGNAALDSTLATARAAVPANLFEAAAQGNVLGIIAASLFFGTALAVNLNQNVPESVRDERETNDVRDERRRRDVRVVADLFLGLNAVVDVAVGWAVKNVPIGVCSIVAARIAGTCDPARALAALLKYVFAVLLGLAVHGLVALPAMYTALVAAREGGRRGLGRGLARDARRAPLDAFAVLRGGAPAFAAAFATDSSSAALPKTIQCAVDLRVPASIAKFSLPLGATLNMNGTALYEALTVLFVAQVHDVDLSLGQTLVVALTSTVAAVGAAAIPSAGLVTMFMVLQAAGLGKYGDDVGALLALDWFLDRARTVVNVEGDLFVAAALAAWEAPPDETEDARWVSEGDVGDVSS